MATECGGIAYHADQSGWGYTAVDSEQEFLNSYYQVASAFLESPVVQGFCYTQLSDVQQEQNGLLTFDRKPKVDCEAIRAINEGRWHPGA